MNLVNLMYTILHNIKFKTVAFFFIKYYVDFLECKCLYCHFKSA